MKKLTLTLLVLALYALHQDFWLWSSADPRLFGFLPPGLVYHAAHTVGSTLLLCLLVKHAWPRQHGGADNRPAES